MKYIRPSFKILEQRPGIEGIYEQIELAGRTCYKSKRPEGKTAKDFVDRMVASQHYAMLEHGTVYLKIPMLAKDIEEYSNNPYSKVSFIKGQLAWYVTTNLRVLVENRLLDDLKYLCEPTEYHKRRVTVVFTTSNGIAREFCRHRVFSFAQESTRYCNYSKDKFGKELTFIYPSWIKYPGGTFEENRNDMFCGFMQACEQSEKYYFQLLDLGYKPQDAREVLPLALKTELVMTGFVSDWKHFFDLRALGTTGAPHPDAKILAEPLMKEFINRGLLKMWYDK
jgi:thymidylate synthase (FAD)